MKDNNNRIEQDSLGSVIINAYRYYGANTQRSINHLPILADKMPIEIIEAIILIKKTAALTNYTLNLMPKTISINYWDSLFQKHNAKLTNSNIYRLITISCNILLNNLNVFYESEFPLSIWQSGSGTQTNMNVNEVLACMTNEVIVFCIQNKINIKRTSKEEIQQITNFAISTRLRKSNFPDTQKACLNSNKQNNAEYTVTNTHSIHPNDHINKSQSSNDTVISAIQIACNKLLVTQLFPSIHSLMQSLEIKQEECKNIIKIGRTHFQYATPITIAQELNGYIGQFAIPLESLIIGHNHIRNLPQGGTAVGTGIGTKKGFGELFCKELNKIFFTELSDNTNNNQGTMRKIIGNMQARFSTLKSQDIKKIMLKSEFSFTNSNNYMAGISGNDSLIALANSVSAFAVIIHKIVSDIIFYSAENIEEYTLPQTNLGSSIMPGKINPIQCESIRMMCTDIISSCNIISSSSIHTSHQLNTFRPLVGYHILRAIKLLACTNHNLADQVISELHPNQNNILEAINKAAMIATPLTTQYGYETISKLILQAKANHETIKQRLMAEKVITTEEEFKALVTESLGEG